MGPIGIGRRLESLAFEIAVEEFEGEVVEEPVPGHQLLTRRHLADPLSGVRAARVLAGAARRLLVEQAEAARAAGRTWDEVDEALGLSDAEGEDSRAEVAFAEIVEGRSRERSWPSLPASSTSWRCGSCGERVTDRGPYDSSHPSDQESG